MLNPYQHLPNPLQRALAWLGERELPMLIMLALIMAMVWGFAEIAEDVMEGDFKSIDEMLLLSLRDASDPSNPWGPSWLEETMRDITALGSTVVLSLVSLAVFGFLLLLQRPKMALLVAVAVLGGLLLSTLLKMGFSRPRPDLVPHGTRVYTASFPSGHSMQSAAVYLTLGALIARNLPRRILKAYILLLMILLTLIIGFSRVYLGVHWPTDVLAGWTAGSAWALLCWLVAYWLQRRGEVENAATTAPVQSQAAG
jgi:undecaprenyl-diphosphatase